MKLIQLILMVLFFTQSGFSQKYINGQANLRDQPNGKIMIQLEDAFQVFVMEQTGDWFKIEFSCLIENSNLADSILPKGIMLFNDQLNPVGKTLSQIELSQFTEPSEKDGFSRVDFDFYTYKTNLKDLSFDEIKTRKDLIVANSAQANVAIYKENGLEFLQKTDVSYAYEYFFDGTDIIRYLICKKEVTRNVLDAEGWNSDITLLFYPNLAEKDTFSYTKHANRFDLINNMLVSTLYGCCGAEDFTELSTFPGNQTFLEFNNRYFVISVPNTNQKLMFGFNVEPRYENQDELLIGELNYSFNHKKSGKIKFVAESKEQLDKIPMYTPEIEFISMTNKDEVQNYQEYSELTLWTIDQENDPTKITQTGVKIIFTDEQSGEKNEYRIIAENGKINEKKVIVDFQK